MSVSGSDELELLGQGALSDEEEEEEELLLCATSLLFLLFCFLLFCCLFLFNPVLQEFLKDVHGARVIVVWFLGFRGPGNKHWSVK